MKTEDLWSGTRERLVDESETVDETPLTSPVTCTDLPATCAAEGSKDPTEEGGKVETMTMVDTMNKCVSKNVEN